MTTRLLARCVHGLEWVCADEITESGLTVGPVGISRREVSFAVDQLDGVSGPAVWPRTADDLLVPVGAAPAATGGPAAADRMGAVLARLPWETALTTVGSARSLPAHPVVDVVAAVEGRRRYSRFDVENALGPRLAALVGGRYLRRTAEGRESGDPDVRVQVRVRGDEVAAAVAVGVTPLHRRAYKLETRSGTLHPPVAAALVRLADLRTGGSLLDPFCGDGTIVIEAATRHPDARVTGSDLDPARITVAMRNAERAGTTPHLEVADAGRPMPRPQTYDAIVTNPPWNLAVDARGSLTRGLEPFWRRAGDLLAPGGRLVVLANGELDILAQLRRAGYGVALGTGLRVAGRIADLVVAAPPGHPLPALPTAAAEWRVRAIRDGVVTATGF